MRIPSQETEQGIRRTVLHLIGYTTIITLGIAGTATALAGRNTVFTDDIKNGQVKTADLGKNAVTGKKVNESTLSKVPNADKVDGISSLALQFPDAVPSGVTVRGNWGVDDEGPASGDFRDFVSYPVKITAALNGNFRPVGAPATANCPGTANAPEAAPGQLCVYNISTTGGTSGGDIVLQNPFGFAVTISDDAIVGDIFTRGTWAATAP